MASLLFWLLAVVSASAQAPGLTLSVNHQKVGLSWPPPRNGMGFFLQEADSLASPTNWQPSQLSASYNTNKGVYSVSLDALAAPRFYRLSLVPPSSVTLTLDRLPDGTPSPPTQIFVLGATNGPTNAMGMSGVPDMHTAVMQQTNGSYKLWIAEGFDNRMIHGATGLLLTTNFLNYTSGHSDAAGNALPVFLPSCRGSTASNDCANQFDADYAGANLVFRGTDGELRMLYHAATRNFGLGPPNQTYPSWCVVGIARSLDQGQGVVWSAGTPIISGSEPKPDTNPPIADVYGVVEPGAIIASNYIYAYYSFFPLPVNSSAVQPAIQVARAPLPGNADPGTWTKYYNGSFGSQPGLLGTNSASQSLGSPIVPTVAGCTRPAQPWPVFSTYLNAYVLVFLASEGWFFSTSTDLVTWTAPKQFFDEPGGEFNGPTDENVILVTPGNPEQQIGQTGYVLYASTPAWQAVPHELWLRPFLFTKSP